MIITRVKRPGVIEVTIPVRRYGQAGAHWQRVLARPNHGGYGRIYIDRFGAKRRRYEACQPFRGYYDGNPGANLDECPGAMFIWTSPRDAHVEAIDAIDNQSLGRDLGAALRQYPQATPEDLWEVVFRFV